MCSRAGSMQSALARRIMGSMGKMWVGVVALALLCAVGARASTAVCEPAALLVPERNPAEGAPLGKPGIADTFLSESEAAVAVSRKNRRFPGLDTNSSPQIKARMQEMAEAGFELVSVTDVRGRVTGMTWIHNPDLVTKQNISDRRYAPPAWVERQKADFARKNNPESKKHAHEVPYPAPGGRALTAKTIDEFEPGVYPFVVLTGENFARLGDPKEKHRNFCGVEEAESAGEVAITRGPDGHNEIKNYNMKSGTYIHGAANIKVFPLALWSQGIYPRSLTGRQTPDQDPIVELEAADYE